MNLPFITATAEGPKHIDATLTRAQFEKLCSDLLDRARRPVEQSLRDAKLSISDIAEVILVGGSTRIPAVQELVKSMTGKDPNVTVNPDEVVALGAAVQVGALEFAEFWLCWCCLAGVCWDTAVFCVIILLNHVDICM